MWSDWHDVPILTYVAANMMESLAKDQFIDGLQDESISLRFIVCKSKPSTLRQALEETVKVESFDMASRHMW